MTKETTTIPNCFYRVSVKAIILDDKKRFFTKEEALKEKLFPNVVQFLSIYNPDNHK